MAPADPARRVALGKLAIIFRTLGASLVTATLLYGVLWLVLHGWKTFPNEWPTYRAFLALYWLTAPLAWIYAIPVERFLDPLTATQANLWFLAIVAVWRVLLITRVVSVVFNASVFRVFFPVMLFAVAVMNVAIQILPLPIISLMGGVRMSPSDQTIMFVSLAIMFLSFYSLWILIPASLGLLFTPRDVERIPPLGRSEQPIERSAWGLAFGLIAFGLVLLPFTQPEQQRRWQAEHLLTSGQVEAGLNYMARYQAADFPPHWDPPPRIGWRGDKGPPMGEVMTQLFQQERPEWITKTYRTKFEDSFETLWFQMPWFWDRLSDEEFDQYLTILEKHPLDEEMRKHQAEGLARVNRAELPHRSPEQFARLRKVLRVEIEERGTDQPSEQSAGQVTGGDKSESRTTDVEPSPDLPTKSPDASPDDVPSPTTKGN